MENVPELLAMTGFLRSFLMSAGYRITFKTINAKNIDAISPQAIFRIGLMSFNRFPNENKASISPERGIGMFLSNRRIIN